MVDVRGPVSFVTSVESEYQVNIHKLAITQTCSDYQDCTKQA